MVKDTERRLIKTLEFLKEPDGSTISSIVKVMNGEGPQVSLKKIVQTLRGCLENGILKVSEGRVKLNHINSDGEVNEKTSLDPNGSRGPKPYAKEKATKGCAKATFPIIGLEGEPPEPDGMPDGTCPECPKCKKKKKKPKCSKPKPKCPKPKPKCPKPKPKCPKPKPKCGKPKPKCGKPKPKSAKKPKKCPKPKPKCLKKPKKVCKKPKIQPYCQK